MVAIDGSPSKPNSRRSSVAGMQSAPIAHSTEEQHDVAAEDEMVPDGLIHDELLIEEISIDGMCGVY